MRKARFGCQEQFFHSLIKTISHFSKSVLSPLIDTTTQNGIETKNKVDHLGKRETSEGYGSASEFWATPKSTKILWPFEEATHKIHKSTSMALRFVMDLWCIKIEEKVNGDINDVKT